MTGPSPSTDSRQDDAHLLVEELRSLVHWGEVRIDCDGDGHWTVTWSESRGGDHDEYRRERSTSGFHQTIVDALRDALREARS